MDAIDRNDAYTVTSLDELAKIYASPLPHVATKETDHITEVGRAFIAASPFLVLATSSGTIDCSPKGDAPGFVQLLDDRTLLSIRRSVSSLWSRDRTKPIA
jgi:predicted pyridoxine 5'-phosphate oxidase superfamily flavin-nucleotide-binding protein